MDTKTAEYYSTHVEDATLLYNSAVRGGVSRYFAGSFIAGSSVLDTGCGSGRDLSILKTMGYDAWGIDASAEMVSHAVVNFPDLKERIRHSAIPSRDLFFNRKFDNILCSAVLMHIPDKDIFDTAYTIRSNLKENGRLLVSIPVERNDLDSEGRTADGRLHIIRPEGYYTLLFERLGFKRTGYYENDDGLGRSGVKWGVILYTLEAAAGTRSIDKIEGILNRDKKTATYKLALIRALADIASTQYNTVKWNNDGTVGVPVRSIAEKWLFYYWPVFESLIFIPQINGETPGYNKPVKFRRSLTALIEKSKSTGGLSAFYNRYYDDSLNKDVMKVLKEIEETIIKGPVYYSGGSLDEGRIFSYNSKNKMVIIPADIWHELCLMWHWIGDALILRWGELTSRISKGMIKASDVIVLLIDKVDVERDTKVSRDIFSGRASLECVWSGRSLNDKFDIDHVIPYALWHNNDLWNLLPAHPRVNNSKSDKLPSRELMIKRKDVIKGYWDMVYGAMPARFGNEVKRFTGKDYGRQWHKALFSAVVEAVEFTAIQRGAGRWEG